MLDAYPALLLTPMEGVFDVGLEGAVYFILYFVFNLYEQYHNRHDCSGSCLERCCCCKAQYSDMGEGGDRVLRRGRARTSISDPLSDVKAK